MLQEYQDALIAASDRRVERLMDSLLHMTYKAEGCAYKLDPTITPSEWEDNLIHDTTVSTPYTGATLYQTPASIRPITELLIR